MTGTTTTPPPRIAVTVNAHPSHWADIWALILKLAPVGATITSEFVPPLLGSQITSGVDLATQVVPIVIQITNTPSPGA